MRGFDATEIVREVIEAVRIVLLSDCGRETLRKNTSGGDFGCNGALRSQLLTRCERSWLGDPACDMCAFDA